MMDKKKAIRAINRTIEDKTKKRPGCFFCLEYNTCDQCLISYIGGHYDKMAPCVDVLDSVGSDVLDYAFVIELLMALRSAIEME